MIKVHNKVAGLHVPEQARSKRRLPWENDDVCKKRKALYNAFGMKKNNHNAENMMRVEDAKAELDKSYYMKQKRYVKKKISIIETAHINHQARHVWATVNEVTCRKKLNEGRIRANSLEERLKLWRSHFEQLLGQPPVLDDQQICNKTFHGDVPGIQLRGGILPFPKKEDLDVTSNYRGIPLSQLALKCTID